MDVPEQQLVHVVKWLSIGDWGDVGVEALGDAMGHFADQFQPQFILSVGQY